MIWLFGNHDLDKRKRMWSVLRCACWALLATTLWSFSMATCAADDTVRLRPNGSVRGTISAMTPTEITVDMVAGQKKQVPVNDVDVITYDGEPPELKLARSEVTNANFEGALKSLDKIDTAKITRAEIKQDLQFYKAFSLCAWRWLAPARSGTQAV